MEIQEKPILLNWCGGCLMPLEDGEETWVHVEIQPAIKAWHCRLTPLCDLCYEKSGYGWHHAKPCHRQTVLDPEFAPTILTGAW